MPRQDCADLNHPIMNHEGTLVGVTKTVLIQLDMKHYLRRHRDSGLLQLKPEYRQMFIELEGGDRPSLLMKMLGTDWRGPNTPVVCRCFECQRKAGQMDNTPLPGQGSVSLDTSARATDLLIQAIKSKRKYK